MLTTASITFSATSAMFSGPRASAENAGSASAAATIATETGRWMACVKAVNRRTMAVNSPEITTLYLRVHPRRHGSKGAHNAAKTKSLD